MNKRIVFWTTTIDELHRNVGNVGGFAVQMNYWSQEFIKNGWEVYSLSRFKAREEGGIKYLRIFYPRYIRIFLEFTLSFFQLLKVRPSVVITRGADRQLSYISKYTSLLGIKHVHFSGSDADFEIKGNKQLSSKDNCLYLSGLRRLKFTVVQNSNQKSLLRKNHFRQQQILVIPNIWPIKETYCQKSKTIDFLWVGNFRDLKRPMWFIELAKRNPKYHFTMIGGISNKALYEECKNIACELPNLEFLGSKSFDEVNEYFTQAKCLVCTSTIEGFPNTFLQAWSNSIPVLSTFDPSGRITKYKLGIYTTDFKEINLGVTHILNENYEELQRAIIKYFKANHNSESRYKELINFINQH